MSDRKIVLTHDETEAVILPCQEDIDKLKFGSLSGNVYYGIETRIPALQKNPRNFLYKLHLVSYFNTKTKEYDYKYYRWVAMWNTGAYHGQFDSIENAIKSVLKLGWKVAQIGNQVNDAIEYKVLHATQGK